MRPHVFLACVLVVLVDGWAASLCASIGTEQEIHADFTDGDTAKQMAEWSEHAELGKGGLGFDGDDGSSYDGWILTQPLAVGTAWRPATAASISVEVAPTLRPIKMSSGQTYTPGPGRMYVRYSPDRAHWSSWQVLESEKPKKGMNMLTFQGEICIPQRARTRYAALQDEYRKLDVPWPDDEEATVRWIVGRDPNFFASELPFVGYVQCVYELSFYAGQRLRSLRVRVGCGIGGMHLPPKDPAEYKKHAGPWRYVAP